MATIGFDSSDAQDASRPPISLHPAFPAIVALWFAALLGIGSLVLPAALLERFVTLTGMAEPPLGFLGRGLIALGAAVAGAVAGVAIARRVAHAHEERPSRAAKLAAGARRPLRVNEELDGERLFNGRALPVTRRRALAIAEDERPSDFLYMAPLPGNDEDDHEFAFDATPPAPAAPEPLELSDALEDPPGPGFAPDFAAPPSLSPDEDEPMTFKQEFQPFAPASRNAEEILADEKRADESRADDFEPLPFAAPSLARRALQAENDPQLAAPQPVASIEPQPAPPEEPRFRGDWAEAPVTELGLVQLVQRLGASLSRRREQVVHVATAAPGLAPSLAAPAGFDAAPAEEAAQAMAAYFGKPAASAAPADIDSAAADEAELAAQPAPFATPQPAPAAPRPSLLDSWHEDDEAELDAMPSFTLPLSRPVVPTIAFEQPAQPQPFEDEDEADPGASDDSFSSLLAMRNPFASKDHAFVRIDEPEPEQGAVEPAVVFPGRAEQPAFAQAVAAPHRIFDPPGEAAGRPAAPAPAATADTDAALRAALATLQRMSGTA